MASAVQTSTTPNFPAVYYLRIPTSDMPDLNSECVLVPVEDPKVQEALWAYDKNHDNVLGQEDVMDAPEKMRGIAAIDGVPTQAQRIAELYVGTQLVIGTNRFFSSPDQLIRYAFAVKRVDQAYEKMQSIKDLPAYKNRQDQFGTDHVTLSSSKWKQIDQSFSLDPVMLALYYFRNWANTNTNLNTKFAYQPDEESKQQDSGNLYYIVQPWDAPRGVQQQLVTTAQRLSAVVAFAKKTQLECTDAQCVAGADSESHIGEYRHTSYSWHHLKGIAILLQTNTEHLSWATMNFFSHEEPSYLSFASDKQMLDTQVLANLLEKKQNGLL